MSIQYPDIQRHYSFATVMRETDIAVASVKNSISSLILAFGACRYSQIVFEEGIRILGDFGASQDEIRDFVQDQAARYPGTSLAETARSYLNQTIPIAAL